MDSDTPFTETRDDPAEVVDEAASTHRSITPTGQGGSLAVPVPTCDDARTIEEREDAEDARLVEAARAEGGPTISLAELKRELGL